MAKNIQSFFSRFVFAGLPWWLKLPTVPASLLERHVCHVKKSLQQELAEIDMGNFLNPPKIAREKVSIPHGEKITVHLVSHSHMDVGWLKTVDQCYFGANNTIQRASCQFILEVLWPHYQWIVKGNSPTQSRHFPTMV